MPRELEYSSSAWDYGVYFNVLDVSGAEVDNKRNPSGPRRVLVRLRVQDTNFLKIVMKLRYIGVVEMRLLQCHDIDLFISEELADVAPLVCGLGASPPHVP